MPRIELVEQPRNLFERLAFWISRRQYGRVITPLKVIYVRKPRFAFLAQMIERTREKGLSLEEDLRLLVVVYIAHLNGCAFCHDLNLSRALQKEIGYKRFKSLPDFRTSDEFSERQQAALAFCEEATQNRDVSDETYAELNNYFNETEIIDLTWLNAAENYFNLQTKILGIGSDEIAGIKVPDQ